MACVGVCGYLIGLALPLHPAFDLPLLFLVVLAALAVVVGRTPPKVCRSLAVLPIVGFVAARLVSSLGAPHVLRSLGLLAPLLPALLLFFLLSEWVETPRQIAAIYVSLTVAGLVLATTLLIGSRFSDTSDADVWARAVPSPLLVVKNDITVVAVLAPLALASASLRPRLIGLVVIGFFASLVIAIGVVQSRTALLTTVVAVIGFTALTPRRRFIRRWQLHALVVGIVAVAFVVDALAGFRFLHKATHDWQGSGRLALWAAAWSMFRDAPLLGHGPDGYVGHYRTYVDALQLPPWIRVDSRATPWAHNLYLELLAEQGIVGLASFLVLSTVGVSMVSRIVRGRDRDARDLGAGAGAAFIAFLVAASFELSFLRAWVTIILFTLLGLLTAMTRSARRAEACKAR